MKALVTSGPTYEPIDPVRFIGNRSSGKQGHAIAEALAARGFEVTLVSGPVSIPDPQGVKVVHVETAKEMFDAVGAALPADVAVFAAAVGDWRVKNTSEHKIKKGATLPAFELVENEDILKMVANCPKNRPKLVIGFAAETEQLLERAQAKLKAKGADWMVANLVDGESVFGEDENEVTLLAGSTREGWKKMSKKEVAEKLVQKIMEAL